MKRAGDQMSISVKSPFGKKASARAFSRTLVGKMLKEWPDRTKALSRKLAFEAAEGVYQSLLQNIPRKDTWSEYRRSLGVVEVSAGEGENVFAVRSKPSTRAVRGENEGDTILYVRPHKRLKKVKPEIQILEKYNPWTLQTLPLTPDRTDAQLVSRKVTKKEADRITKLRLRDKHIWRSELGKTGVRLKSRADKTKVVKTVPDVAFEAMRLEFGIGRNPEPHWRPSVSDMARNGIKAIARRREIQSTLATPNFTGWKLWEKIQAQTVVREDQARSYIPFQRRLGIRVGR